MYAITRSIEKLAQLEVYADIVFNYMLQKNTREILFLSGPIGAGKTTFVQLGMKSIGYSGLVNSPTFSILNEYDVSGVTILHADFYRLSSSDELELVGWDLLYEMSQQIVIEWPENIQGFSLKPTITIEMSVGESGRQCSIGTDDQVLINRLIGHV